MNVIKEDSIFNYDIFSVSFIKTFKNIHIKTKY